MNTGATRTKLTLYTEATTEAELAKAKLLDEVHRWLVENGFHSIEKKDGADGFIKFPRKVENRVITVKITTLSSRTLEIWSPYLPMKLFPTSDISLNVLTDLLRRESEKAHTVIDKLEEEEWVVIHEWFDVTLERVGDARRLLIVLARVLHPFKFFMDQHLMLIKPKELKEDIIQIPLTEHKTALK